MTTPTAAAEQRNEAACPDCGHDVDHTTKCPAGCPQCNPLRAWLPASKQGALDEALAAERRATVERIRADFLAKWEPVVPGQGLTKTRADSIRRWAEIRKGHVLAILDEEAAR